MKFTPHLESHLQAPHPPLTFYKVQPEAFEPVWATEHSACFDLKACLVPGQPVKIFERSNTPALLVVLSEPSLYLMPGSRVMVPTGLILGIPTGYSVRLHSRSGLAVKQGIVLANHEGVIDSDYVDPTMVVLTNDSAVSVTINHGDRIAQGEMIPDISYEVIETFAQPMQKTSRAGGFGSTGK